MSCHEVLTHQFGLHLPDPLPVAVDGRVASDEAGNVLLLLCLKAEASLLLRPTGLHVEAHGILYDVNSYILQLGVAILSHDLK